jgi:hypothetical protein
MIKKCWMKRTFTNISITDWKELRAIAYHRPPLRFQGLWGYLKMLLRRQGDWRWGTRLRSFLKGKNFMAVFLIVENKKSPLEGD